MNTMHSSLALSSPELMARLAITVYLISAPYMTDRVYGGFPANSTVYPPLTPTCKCVVLATTVYTYL